MIHSDILGKIVDRGYRLQDQLGEGGMGTVYRSTQLVSGQVVALKLISQRLRLNSQHDAEESQNLHRRLTLAREFQTLASLHHPNVIRVLSYGFDEDLGSYFTMELLESPQTLVEAAVGQAEEVKAQLIAQLLRALSYVHRRGVLHRDIKPGNVLVVRGEVKLLDFGIATEASSVSDVAGTIDYMAPEILVGERPSVGSDLYAVGVVLHQILTGMLPRTRQLMEDDNFLTVSPEIAELLQGRSSPPASGRGLPFRAIEEDPAAKTDSEVTDRAIESQSSNPSSDPPFFDEDGPLGRILRRLLEPNPGNRYDSASMVLRELAASVPYELPVETAATRESFLQATAFVGREQELAKLAQVQAHLTGQSGKAFLIGGESGVGKSRLLSEFRTLALVHGCWIAEGQSVTEGGYLYHEWLPLLRALCFQVDISDSEASAFKGVVPDLEDLLARPIPDPPPMKPEAAFAHLSATLISLLSRRSKQLVLILEDLHWGRSESLALLSQVAKSVAAIPHLIIIGTYRSDESPDLPKALPNFELIILQRLQRHEVERLSASMLGAVGKQPQLVDYLLRHTEGNIFFLVEVVRALAEFSGELERVGDQGSLPENMLTARIGRIVERRIDNIPAAYRELLDFSALVGRKLDLATLQRVFPESPLREFLLACANVAVLESQGSDWRFAHDKLRETLIVRMEPAKRQRLHLRIAEALEGRYTEKEREQFAATLGHHYRQAGIFDKALQYYIQAGDKAAKVYAYEQARAHYHAAGELLPRLAETIELRRLQVDILIKEVQCSLNHSAPDLNHGRMARAREIIESLQATGVAVHEDRLRLARIDYYRARLYSYTGQPGQAVPFFRRVIPVAQEFQDQELIAVSSAFLGLVQFLHGSVSDFIALLEASAEPMERLFGKDIDTMRGYVYLATGYAAAGKYRSGWRLIEHVTPWVAEVQQASYSGVYWLIRGLCLMMAGDWPAALHAAERALACAQESREPTTEYLALDVQAWMHSHLGNYEAAITNRTKAVELRSHYGGGMARDWFDAAEIEIHLKGGQSERAVEHAQKMASTLRSPFSLCVAQRAWGEALAKLGGDPAEVDARLRESLEIANRTGMVMNAIRAELVWGQVCKARGDVAGTRSHFQEVQRRMTDELAPHARDEIAKTMQHALDA